jgi:hypothetical protein
MDAVMIETPNLGMGEVMDVGDIKVSRKRVNNANKVEHQEGGEDMGDVQVDVKPPKRTAPPKKPTKRVAKKAEQAPEVDTQSEGLASGQGGAIAKPRGRKPASEGASKNSTDALGKWRGYVAEHKGDRKEGEPWKEFMKRLGKEYPK